MLKVVKLAAGLAVSLSVMQPASAQEPPPYVPNAWKFGPRTDEGQLRYCVDARDAGWEVAQDIGEAIAGALLLEPVPHLVESGLEVQALEDLYPIMLEHCAIHLGFKLLPGAYPSWLTLTREYYTAGYVFVTADPTWQSLAEVPRDAPIASIVGTRADLRLTSYLTALGPGERWPRFPIGIDLLALRLVQEGRAAVALVWEPVLWAARAADPALDGLRVIASDPLPETREAVGAVILARETFLRASVDEAIAALVADGSIAAILERHGFPATAGP